MCPPAERFRGFPQALRRGGTEWGKHLRKGGKFYFKNNVALLLSDNGFMFVTKKKGAFIFIGTVLQSKYYGTDEKRNS